MIATTDRRSSFSSQRILPHNSTRTSSLARSATSSHCVFNAILERCVDQLALRADLQRPTAKDLLKHKFIRTARKASYLTELIERHEKWRAEGGAKPLEEAPRDPGECVWSRMCLEPN